MKNMVMWISKVSFEIRPFIYMYSEIVNSQTVDRVASFLRDT